MLAIVELNLGDTMKVIVITNVPDGAEDLVNAFDGSGLTIVSKEVDSVGRIVEEAQAALDKSYSAIIVNTDSPAEANIRLNKAQNIRAYTCSNSNDVRAARKGRVNTIILSGHVNADLRDAVLSMLSGGMPQAPMSAPAQRSMPMRQQPQRQPPPPPKRARPAPEDDWSTHAPSGPQPMQDEQYDDQDQQQPMPQMKPRKGLLGKIKDSLGIMDDSQEPMDPNDGSYDQDQQ